jgi:hypothetical protein
MNSHFTKLRLDTPIFESKFPNRSDSVGINLPWEKVFRHRTPREAIDFVSRLL